MLFNLRINHRLGPGRLCSKAHLLFYSIIPKKLPIILFNLPIILALSLSSVFVTHYCRYYGFSVTERLMWSTLNGLFMCIFDVVRVKRLFTLVESTVL